MDAIGTALLAAAADERQFSVRALGEPAVQVLNPRPVAVEPVPAQKGSTNIFGFFGKKPEPAGPVSNHIC